MKDKNSKELNVGDYICLDNLPNPFLITNGVSIGINVDEKDILPMLYLLNNYQKEGNRVGFIPLVFLKKEIIQYCNPDEYPECHI